MAKGPHIQTSVKFELIKMLQLSFKLTMFVITVGMLLIVVGIYTGDAQMVDRGNQMMLGFAMWLLGVASGFNYGRLKK